MYKEASSHHIDHHDHESLVHKSVVSRSYLIFLVYLFLNSYSLLLIDNLLHTYTQKSMN